MQVRHLTRKEPVSVGPETPVREVARVMDERVVGAVVVVDGERPIGIVTDRDLVVRLLARGLPDDARVDSVMTVDPVVLDADASPTRAVHLFERHAVRRLPLVDAGRFVGLLAVDDLLVNTVADLTAVVRPITGEVIFGHPEPHATLAEQ
jgi:signal-transduction protein with cAMP-binding, CBS, and nucleotidyltransferase domain